jgi:protein-tyrosine phosphatase
VISWTRQIRWPGFHNARDLGGLPTLGGPVTRFGTLIRSGDPRFVTPAGWQAARAAGFRTIIDLRNDDEVRPEASLAGLPAGSATLTAGSAAAAPAPPLDLPAGLERTQVPLDDIQDVCFWRRLNDEGLNGTPLYYRPFLAAKPGRCAAVLAAIARARPGGVIFHCTAGRDRTGLIAMLLLALAGVRPAAIADDYALSAGQVGALFAALDVADSTAGIEAELRRRGTTARAALLDALSGLDPAARLRAAGLRDTDITALRARLLD